MKPESSAPAILARPLLVHPYTAALQGAGRSDLGPGRSGWSPLPGSMTALLLGSQSLGMTSHVSFIPHIAFSSLTSSFFAW